MRKILLFSILLASLGNISYAGEQCDLDYKYGFRVGYPSGVADKKNGYEYSPEQYYNLPLMQIGLKAVKESSKTKFGTYFDEFGFDRCFKKGFLDGYRGGYPEKQRRK